MLPLIAAICLSQTLSFFGGVGGRGNDFHDPEIAHLLSGHSVTMDKVLCSSPFDA
jgi:hypothetical protein